MDYNILPNGNLEITCNRNDKPGLRDMLAKTHNDGILLAELLESTGWQPNGRLHQISPEDVAALTDAPMLTDDMTVEDDATVTVHGQVYWYPNYMVTNFMEELLNEGRTIFQRAEPVLESAPREAMSA
jgi:hypothetical protein